MKQLTVRLPDDLHALLKERAGRERRSMHAELLRIVERELTGGGPDGGPVAPAPSRGAPDSPPT